jgi:hypothetical protein
VRLYAFHRQGMFYPIQLKDDLDACRNAECNPGTIKVTEEPSGRVVWLHGKRVMKGGVGVVSASSRPAAAETPDPIKEAVDAIVWGEGNAEWQNPDGTADRFKLALLIEDALRAEYERGAREMRERCVDALAEAGNRRVRRSRELGRTGDIEGALAIGANAGPYHDAAKLAAELPLTPPAQDGGSDTQP